MPVPRQPRHYRLSVVCRERTGNYLAGKFNIKINMSTFTLSYCFRSAVQVWNWLVGGWWAGAAAATPIYICVGDVLPHYIRIYVDDRYTYAFGCGPVSFRLPHKTIIIVIHNNGIITGYSRTGIKGSFPLRWFCTGKKYFLWIIDYRFKWKKVNLYY